MFKLVFVTQKFLWHTLQPEEMRKHRHYLSQEQGREVDMNEAGCDWADTYGEKVRESWDKLKKKLVLVDLEKPVPEVLHVYPVASFELVDDWRLLLANDVY